MFGLDDLIVPAFSAAASLFGGQQRNDAQQQAANQANAFSAQQYATRYQTTVKDMEAAGLSPMLAYGQGAGSPPTGQQAQMQDVATPAVGAATQAYSAAKISTAQADLLEAQTDAARAQAEKTRAETPTSGAGSLGDAEVELKGSSAAQNRASVASINANVDKIKAEIPLLNAQSLNAADQGKVLRQTVQMLADQAALMAEQGNTQHSIRAHIQAQIDKLVTETSLNKLDIDAASAFGNVGRTTKELEPFLKLIWNALVRRH